MIFIVLIFPVVRGEMTITRVYWEPEVPDPETNVDIFIEITSDNNITGVNVTSYLESPEPREYGGSSSEITFPADMVDRTNNTFVYRGFSSIKDDCYSPLKITITASDSQGNEVSELRDIPFEGGVKRGSSEGVPGFVELHLAGSILAVAVVCYLLRRPS